jgi:hypothetical protein
MSTAGNEGEGLVRRVRSVILFARDLWTELPAVWAIALANRCDRDGGHQWEGGPQGVYLNGMPMPAVLRCARCGSTRMIATTLGTYAYGSPVNWSN